MISIQPYLKETKDMFIPFLSQEPAAVEAFCRSWSSLQMILGAALERDCLDETVLIEAYTTVHNVQALATAFLELYEKADAVTAALHHDVEGIFGKMKLEDGSKNHCPSRPSPVEESTPRILPYLPAANQWLLQNLHDPYPSKEVKLAIASETNSSPRDIDRWFNRARKRIGWNDLRIKHFQNKRSKIIAAATQFFSNRPSQMDENHLVVDSTRNLDSHAIRFITVFNNARNLYCNEDSPLSSRGGDSRHITLTDEKSERCRQPAFDSSSLERTPMCQKRRASSPLSDSEGSFKRQRSFCAVETPSIFPTYQTLSCRSSAAEILPSEFASITSRKRKRSTLDTEPDIPFKRLHTSPRSEFDSSPSGDLLNWSDYDFMCKTVPCVSPVAFDTCDNTDIGIFSFVDSFSATPHDVDISSPFTDISDCAASYPPTPESFLVSEENSDFDVDLFAKDLQIGNARSLISTVNMEFPLCGDIFSPPFVGFDDQIPESTFWTSGHISFGSEAGSLVAQLPCDSPGRGANAKALVFGNHNVSSSVSAGVESKRPLKGQ